MGKQNNRCLMNLSVLKQSPNWLKELNVIAVTEVYEGVKFQCSNCGQRFVRNELLKAHLDQHFAENNEVRRRKRVAPLMYPSLTIANSVNASVPANSVGTMPIGQGGGNGLGTVVGVMSDNRPLTQGLQSWVS